MPQKLRKTRSPKEASCRRESLHASTEADQQNVYADLFDIPILHQVVHPMILRIEPCFDFSPRHLPSAVKGQEYVAWNISVLADSLAAILSCAKRRREAMPLPEDIAPSQVMAAVALALHMADVQLQDLCRPRCARKNLHDATFRPGSANTCTAPERDSTAAQSFRPSSAACTARNPLPVGRSRPSILFAMGCDSTDSRNRALGLQQRWHLCQRDTARLLSRGSDLLKLNAKLAESVHPNSQLGKQVALASATASLCHAQTLPQPSFSWWHAKRTGQVKGKGHPMPSVAVSQGSCFQVAVQLHAMVIKDASIGVMLPCSAFRVGGAFTLGDSRGPEEEACIRSTVFAGMQRAASEVGDASNWFPDLRGNKGWLPDDGVLRCSDVRVFRGSSASGWSTLDCDLRLTVFCMRLPNLASPCNSKNKHIYGPGGGNLLDDRYTNLMRQKFQAMLVSAADANLEILVISDESCSELCNHPDLFGYSLGRVLLETKSSVRQVVLTGSRDFTRGVHLGMLGPTAS